MDPFPANIEPNTFLTRPSLKHQRPQEEKQKVFDPLTSWYKRGEVQGPTVRKYRKGACDNCGSMSHKKKDCMEVIVCIG